MVLTIAVLALAACGDDDVDLSVASPAPAPTTPETSLTITLDTGNGTPAQEWTLTCDPPGGTHPDQARACVALASLDPEVFEPVAPDQMCAQIYGGPEAATCAALGTECRWKFVLAEQRLRDSPLGRGNRVVSGGQRQRLADQFRLRGRV